MNEFYDVVDSDGNVVETAAEQASEIESKSAIVSIPLPPKELTPGELKKARKVYVTVQLPKVQSCGHRLDLSKQPRNRNCEACWYAFFANHAELVQQCDEMFQADGGKLMSQLQGPKFTKRFTQFMSTLAQWKQVESNV